MARKDFVPLAMALTLFAAILALAVTRGVRIHGIRTEHPVNPEYLLVGIYLLWMVFETRISWKDRDGAEKHTADAFTCQLYGAGQALTILTALWFQPVWTGPGAAQWVGLSLVLSGIAFRLWAIRSLGRFYSHRVRITGDHRVVRSVPYGLVRHPAYLGMITAHAGVLLIFLNPVTAGVFFLLFIPAILLRIFTEEKTLLGIAGYADYANHRKRLIPKIW